MGDSVFGLCFALPGFMHGLQDIPLIGSAQHDKIGFAPNGARFKNKRDQYS